MKQIKNTVLFGLILVIIDTIWISSYMGNKYRNWFKSINVDMKINYLAIGLAYITMVGIYPLFIKNNNKKKELINAALIGAIVFGLYGFTVAAIFPKYGLDFAFTEVLWGAFLYTITTFLVQKINI